MTLPAELQLNFDNSFIRTMPGDETTEVYPRQVRGACYSRVMPTPVSNPTLVAHSPEVSRLIGLVPGAWDHAELVAVLGGSSLLPGMEPYAACYGGHQFGHWAGQLGDGRAISLGEVVNDAGERWELQLKGAGLTPYSRMADGRAVMRSSVREFLCSEAMFHLGVPTTRALSLVSTGDQVLRDMFYDGNAQYEPGAVVTRVAPSFLRFGNYELLAARREHELLGALVDYTIRTHFPHLDPSAPEARAQWFAEICKSTAEMIVHWQRVGFVHGVMNTDNMAILGLTIDYGPYGWLEGFDPHWTPNTTDAEGRRYAFGNQPNVAMWNLSRLGSALATIVEDVSQLESGLELYRDTFQSSYRQMLCDKLGLGPVADGDEALSEQLMHLLQRVETDMTLFYRGLADVPSSPDASDDELLAPLAAAYYDEVTPEVRAETIAWLRSYGTRARRDGRTDDSRRAAMNQVNPRFVPRNYLAQLAIDRAEEGDGSGVTELLEVLRHPYDDQPDRVEQFGGRRPEWARNRAGCSMLS